MMAVLVVGAICGFGGYRMGHQAGYDVGQQQGSDEGFKRGKSAGITEGMETQRKLAEDFQKIVGIHDAIDFPFGEPEGWILIKVTKETGEKPDTKWRATKSYTMQEGTFELRGDSVYTIGGQ